MKKILFASLALVAATAMAADPSVMISRQSLGSGTPGMAGHEKADLVMNNMFHAPQYMPAYPTAGTIWPRVVEVPCTKAADSSLKCEGYEWLPKYGRGEYLYVQPVVMAPVEPVIKEVVKTVIKEVEVKPKKE